MSGIISYVKRIGVWLCIVIACETIMIITMMLNKIPFAEIGYGIFISLFLLLILLAFDAMRYYRHYQKRKGVRAYHHALHGRDAGKCRPAGK